MSAVTHRPSRPQSSYGRRSSSFANTSDENEQRLRRRNSSRGEELERRNVATEWKINKRRQAKPLRRLKSDAPRQEEDKDANKTTLRHHGDENITDDELSLSMPERLMRLKVNEAKEQSNNTSTSFPHIAFDDLPTTTTLSKPNLRSPGHSTPSNSSNKLDMPKVRLAGRKTRLEPLPNRQQRLRRRSSIENE